MKERPILFSAPMVRALLDGRKTQTRRIVKSSPVNIVPFIGADNKPTGEFGLCLEYERVINKSVSCPFGQPGDRLWVREAWRTYASLDENRPTGINPGAGIQYEAGGSNVRGYDQLLGMGRFRPGMFMPHWASRITLEVTDVRVERLQDISEQDCWAEGIERSKESPSQASTIWSDYSSPRRAFNLLWESIHGEEGWTANPWVWKLTFKRITP